MAGAAPWAQTGLPGHLAAATPAGPLAPVAFPGFGTPATGATGGAATPASLQQGVGGNRPFFPSSLPAALPSGKAPYGDAHTQQGAGLQGVGAQLQGGLQAGGPATGSGAGTSETPTSAMSFAGTPMSITLTPAVTPGDHHHGGAHLESQQQQQQQQQAPVPGHMDTAATPLQALQRYPQGQQQYDQYYAGSDIGDHDMGIASPQPSASVTGSGSPATPVLFLRGSDQQQRQKQQRGAGTGGTRFGGSSQQQQPQQQHAGGARAEAAQADGAQKGQGGQHSSQNGQQGAGAEAAEAEGRGPGCGLAGNVDVVTCRADWLYHRYVHSSLVPTILQPARMPLPSACMLFPADSPPVTCSVL